MDGELYVIEIFTRVSGGGPAEGAAASTSAARGGGEVRYRPVTDGPIR